MSSARELVSKFFWTVTCSSLQTCLAALTETLNKYMYVSVFSKTFSNTSDSKQHVSFADKVGLPVYLLLLALHDAWPSTYSQVTSLKSTAHLDQTPSPPAPLLLNVYFKFSLFDSLAYGPFIE